MKSSAKGASQPALKLVPADPDEPNPGQLEKNERFGGATRIQILMPSASVDRLVAIKDTIEAASVAEVVRRAIRLYEALLAEEREGGEVYIRRSRGGGDVILPVSYLFH